MKKYTKKDRKTIEDPKVETTGPKRKKKPVEKNYHLMYKQPVRLGWNPPNAGEWKVYSSFAKKEDRDHELEKAKRSYQFWEWCAKDD